MKLYIISYFNSINPEYSDVLKQF